MPGFKIDYEVIDSSITESKIIQERFSHLFDVDVLGRFWSQLIDRIEGSTNVDLKTRMKSWLELMMSNKTLVEPFDTIPIPVSKGSLPILARYNYTIGEIRNAIAVQTGVGLNETVKLSPPPNQGVPQATSTVMKQQRMGRVPVVTEETTITQSHTYDTADGTVTEVRVVEVAPQALRKKIDPFAPSSNWMMDEPPSPLSTTPVRRGRNPRQPQETPKQAPPDQSTMAPRKKIDPFAPSSNWMMDDSPPPVVQSRRTRVEPPPQLTPVQPPLEQPTMAPRKKIDPFAPSVAWYGDDSPQKPATPQRTRPRQQEATVPQQRSPPRIQKRNDFASSLAFDDPVSPKRVPKPRQEEPRQQQVPPQAPMKPKRNDFASSIGFGGHESPETPASRYVKPTQQMATVTEMPTRPKRNDFATSITFGSPEKPSQMTVADKTTVKQTRIVETSDGITSESKTITSTKTKTSPDPQVGFNTQRGSAYRSTFTLGSPSDDVPDVQRQIRDAVIEEPANVQYQSRRGDAYRSNIGFGGQQDSPPRHRRTRPGTEPVTQAPVQTQEASQVYQSRRGDAYKSSISFF